MNLPKHIYSTKIQITVILILTFLAFSNIFPNTYLGDDRAFFVSWEEIKHIESIPKFFLKKSNPTGLPMDYRPVWATVLDLCYQIWGSDIRGYHFFSILVHLSSTILTYFITRELVLSIRYLVLRKKKKPIIHNTNPIIPFATALLFGLHPIHTESITYTVVGFNSLSFVFMFGSLLLYLKSNSTMQQFNNSYYYISLALAAAAYFTYEMTLTLPFLIILYHFVFKVKKAKSQRLLKIWFPYFALVGFYLVMRLFVAGLINDRGNYFMNSFYLNMLIMPKLFLKYFELLVLPVDLSFIHRIIDGFETYPTPYSNFEGIRNLSPFSLENLAFISIMTALGLIFIKTFKKNPLISFAIGWFFITILPISNIFPLGVTMTERYMYLPSFGFCLLLSLSLINISNSNLIPIPSQQKNKAAILFSLLLLLTAVFYFYRTYTRNFNWQNIETLTRSILKVYPDSLIARYNLALNYGPTNPQAAIEQYQTLLSIEPRFKEAAFDLGNIYFSLNNWNLAAQYFNQTIKLDPNFMDAYLNLAHIHIQQGNFDQAEAEIKRALQIDTKKYLVFDLPKSQPQLQSSYINAYNHLATVYFNQKRLDLTEKALNNALKIDPNDQTTLNNLSILKNQ